MRKLEGEALEGERMGDVFNMVSCGESSERELCFSWSVRFVFVLFRFVSFLPVFSLLLMKSEVKGERAEERPTC